MARPGSTRITWRSWIIATSLNSVGVSLKPANPIPSTVSFDVHFTGTSGGEADAHHGHHESLRGPGHRQHGHDRVVRKPSTGLTLHTTPGEHPKTVSGVIGHECTGRFFPSGSVDD